MVEAIHHQLLILFVIGLLFNVQGSAGKTISPSPAILPAFPPHEEMLGPVQQGGSFEKNAPSSWSQPNGSNLNPPVAPPPLISAPDSQDVSGHVPSLSPTTSMVTPSNDISPPLVMIFPGNVPSMLPLTSATSPSYSTSPPFIAQGHTPPAPSISPEAKAPFAKAPLSVSISPLATPLSDLLPKSSDIHPSIPPSSPPNVHHNNSSFNRGPVLGVIAPVASPPKNSGQHDPVVHQIALSPVLSTSPDASVPVMSPIGGSPQNSSANHPLAPGELSSPSPLPGKTISPSPAILPAFPPPEEMLGPVQQVGSFEKNAPSSRSQPNGSNLNPPVAPPPLISTPDSQDVSGHVPSLSPTTSMVPPSNDISLPLVMIFPGNVPSMPPFTSATSPSYSTAPPLIAQGHAPPAPSISPEAKAPFAKAPLSVSISPLATPLSDPLPKSSDIHPSIPPSSPPNVHHNNSSFNGGPVLGAISSVASPPKNSGQHDPMVHQIAPSPVLSTSPGASVPVMSPIGGSPQNSSANHPPAPGGLSSPSPLPVSYSSHPSTPSPSTYPKEGVVPVAVPSVELPPINHSPTKGSYAIASSTHEAMRHSDAQVPSLSSTGSPATKWFHSPASLPSIPVDKNHSTSKANDHAPASSYNIFPSPKQQGPSPFIPPSSLPTRKTHHTGLPLDPVASSGWDRSDPIRPPNGSPSESSSRNPKIPLPPPVLALPPPPPNEDCLSTVCIDPYTNTPPGSPCTCVLPMQVGLRLSVALYTFFPLVLELAQEIAAGIFMKQSQVRIMGANAAGQQPEKTIVLIDLVPLGERFDNTTAFFTFQKFWHKQVTIKASHFGDYDVLYVRYPGLPPSPPMAPSGLTIIDDGPYSGNNDNAIKPIGVDIRKRHQMKELGAGAIAIITLSAFVALVLFAIVAWVLTVRKQKNASLSAATPQLVPSLTKPSGTTGSVMGSGIGSASSFVSSITTYTGSAKTFSSSDIERATNNFDSSRILGEGGFGRVYSGVLEDGTNVAVKILKRDDHHSGREFLAEVEMLSRLHHRNLVKLTGICTEEHTRCLVYELIPNGSVESHLHGNDKDPAPLDWDARIKIALGAARGLAYLHEDSSPRVIHRDFKSSNILLEHDFTPKVSDFGLARTAMDEENRHISTRVMGTFGYVAPEYAMTGHLLVKSDVYSYGVVLLELLTGRKPVDMMQPPGQENLVAWARPLLTTREGLEEIIDLSLGPDVPFESVAKVAAIASMCVQPEVSHRPFMGEVVQALKLVSNECDEAKEVHSGSSSHELYVDMDARVSTSSGQLLDPFQNQNLPAAHYDSEPDIENGLSLSDLLSSSVRFSGQASRSFRRYSSSGPLRTGRGKNLWQKIRRLRGESVSEHGILFKTWPVSN